VSYATPTDIKARFDARVIGDLVGDVGTRVDATGLNTDTVLQACLDDASGAIDAALLSGQRYIPTDLAGLTGSSAKHLVRITCDVAMMYLADRRVYAKRNETVEKIVERSLTYLKQLASGEDLFYIPAAVAAAAPVTTGPTTTTLENLNSIRRRTRKYFPTEVLPNNR
jgi:phage gp36-like protein